MSGQAGNPRESGRKLGVERRESAEKPKMKAVGVISLLRALSKCSKLTLLFVFSGLTLLFNVLK